jgi:hypothetical protein
MVHRQDTPARGLHTHQLKDQCIWLPSQHLQNLWMDRRVKGLCIRDSMTTVAQCIVAFHHKSDSDWHIANQPHQ